MPTQPTTNNLEESIEKLAMALTHSEQGFYDKNEEYVRAILSDLRKHDMEELIKMLPVATEEPEEYYKQSVINFIKEYYAK